MASILTESVLESKQDIRRRVRAHRKSLSQKDILAWSDCIAARILKLDGYRHANTVLVYLALPDEVQTDRLVAEARHVGKQIAVPAVLPDIPDLVLAAYTGPESVPFSGPFGIRQPESGHFSPVPANRIDLVLAPGLAFDRQGNRLGYGKGYFDRLFAQLTPDCLRVGLAFDFQVLDTVPVTPVDLPVHLVVTEHETIACPR